MHTTTLVHTHREKLESNIKNHLHQPPPMTSTQTMEKYFNNDASIKGMILEHHCCQIHHKGYTLGFHPKEVWENPRQCFQQGNDEEHRHFQLELVHDRNGAFTLKLDPVLKSITKLKLPCTVTLTLIVTLQHPYTLIVLTWTTQLDIPCIRKYTRAHQQHQQSQQRCQEPLKWLIGSLKSSLLIGCRLQT